jgi:hypothetical protein
MNLFKTKTNAKQDKVLLWQSPMIAEYTRATESACEKLNFILAYRHFESIGELQAIVRDREIIVTDAIMAKNPDLARLSKMTTSIAPIVEGEFLQLRNCLNDLSIADTLFCRFDKEKKAWVLDQKKLDSWISENKWQIYAETKEEFERLELAQHYADFVNGLSDYSEKIRYLNSPLVISDENERDDNYVAKLIPSVLFVKSFAAGIQMERVNIGTATVSFPQ